MEAVHEHITEITKLVSEMADRKIKEVVRTDQDLADRYMLMKQNFRPSLYKIDYNGKESYLRLMIATTLPEYNSVNKDWAIKYISVDINGAEVHEYKWCLNISSKMFIKGIHTVEDWRLFFENEEDATEVCLQLN